MGVTGCVRILWLALLGAAALPAADAEQIRKAAASVARDLDVQQKLPNDSDSTEAASDGRSEVWFPGSEGGQGASVPAAVWSIVQWAMIAIVVVAVAAWLGIWFTESRQRRQAVVPGVNVKPGERQATLLDPGQALALADEWAAAGRYGPAMHQVWLAAAARLAPRLDHNAPDSLTSWELLNTVKLQAAERQALRNVVARVDRAWFGEQPARLEDYQAVRGSYQAFASAAGAATA